MASTIYIAPAVTELGSRCNVYHLPYHIMDTNTIHDNKDMVHIGTLEWQYAEKCFKIVCLDRSLVGDLTDDDFKYSMGGTYYPLV